MKDESFIDMYRFKEDLEVRNWSRKRIFRQLNWSGFF